MAVVVQHAKVVRQPSPRRGRAIFLLCSYLRDIISLQPIASGGTAECEAMSPIMEVVMTQLNTWYTLSITFLPSL